MFMSIFIGYVIISILAVRSLVIYETKTSGIDVKVSDFLMMLAFSCVPMINVAILITFTWENRDASSFIKKYKSSILNKVMFEKREG